MVKYASSHVVLKVLSMVPLGISSNKLRQTDRAKRCIHICFMMQNYSIYSPFPFCYAQQLLFVAKFFLLILPIQQYNILCIIYGRNNHDHEHSRRNKQTHKMHFFISKQRLLLCKIIRLKEDQCWNTTQKYLARIKIRKLYIWLNS